MSGISVKPVTRDAYRLFHDGSLALSEAEFNGIRTDREYCQRMSANLDRQVQSLGNRMLDTELGKAWKARFPSPTWGNDHQLRKVIYDDLGIEVKSYTSGGKGKGKSKTPSTKAEVLQGMDVGGIDVLLKIRTTDKLSTGLKGLLRESEADGLIHPFFHLSGYGDDKDGGARSFRGSSSDPNFQNFPKHDPYGEKVIRRALLPRPGHRIVGRDYGSMEFRISACLHHDQNMLRYIEQGDDPHRDVAAHCFLLPPKLCTKAYGEFGKNVRFAGKNNGTFAQMYFQDPPNTAKGLWKAISALNLRYPADPEKSLFEHLKDKGIRNYDAFEKHIVDKAVPWFWTDMFPDYWKWRVKWLEDYQRNGYFDMMTGFRVEGVLTRYQLGNYPIQGPAFHILLKSLIKTHQLWEKKREDGWKSLIIGQIHDELTTDEPQEEFHRNQDDIVNIMQNEVRKDWDWIITPLEVEVSVTPVDGNWFEKKDI